MEFQICTSACPKPFLPFKPNHFIILKEEKDVRWLKTFTILHESPY
jgi:hypothetical protein